MGEKKTFERYAECKKIVGGMSDGGDKEFAEITLNQLLHIEQCRSVADKHYKAYCGNMNAWEENIVREIKRMAEAQAALERKG